MRMSVKPRKLLPLAFGLAALCSLVEGQTICRNLNLISFPPAKVDELCFAVGQPVTLQGMFSLRGKLGPFVVIGGRTVYLIARGSFSWGKSYESMEGRVVAVTGTLRFYKAPPLRKVPVAEASLPDHYYMEAESTKVALAK